MKETNYEVSFLWELPIELPNSVKLRQISIVKILKTTSDGEILCDIQSLGVLPLAGCGNCRDTPFHIQLEDVIGATASASRSAASSWALSHLFDVKLSMARSVRLSVRLFVIIS